MGPLARPKLQSQVVFHWQNFAMGRPWDTVYIYISIYNFIILYKLSCNQKVHYIPMLRIGHQSIDRNLYDYRYTRSV